MDELKINEAFKNAVKKIAPEFHDIMDKLRNKELQVSSATGNLSENFAKEIAENNHQITFVPSNLKEPKIPKIFNQLSEMDNFKILKELKKGEIGNDSIFKTNKLGFYMKNKEIIDNLYSEFKNYNKKIGIKENITPFIYVGKSLK